MNRFYLTPILFLLFHTSLAQKIKGTILDEKNEPLSFASIFVKNTSIGTNSNEKGEFLLNLKPGDYEVVFRYLGYQTQIKNLVLNDEDLIISIKLAPEVIQLAEAQVGNIKEDPALSIMRKTIAMSVFHYNELQSFSFKTYLKGNLKILDIPFVFEKLAKKNFVEKNQLYVFESVHQIQFNQPSKLSEKVIAKKDNLPPNLKGGVNISMGKYEIYSPNNSTSPVTKKGARNYRYEYLGYFEENGIVINKIKVIPKVKGYYSGTMNIVDGSWYIHSYDFIEEENDGKTKTKAIFSQLDGVWFLSNIDLSSQYKNLGLDVEMRAVAANKEIKLTKNPKYASVKPEIIDEKLFKEKADLKPKDRPIQKEATLKDLQNLAKNMGKEDRKVSLKNNEPDIDKTYIIDSTAEKKDSIFWQTERQVPLTIHEIKGFKQADSLYIVNFEAINKKIKKDSVKLNNGSKFKFPHLLVGHTYNFNKIKDSSGVWFKNQIIVGNILEGLRFNAVEGYGIGMNRMDFKRNISKEKYLKIGLKANYSINRNRLNGESYFNYQLPKDRFAVSFGRNVFQINEENPVHPINNALFALLNNQHMGRFFEKKFIDLSWNHRISTGLRLNTLVSFQNRNLLPNIVNKGWVTGHFESENAIVHANNRPYLPNTQSNRIFIISRLDYSPNVRVNVYNGTKRTIKTNEPRFTLKNTLSVAENRFGILDFEAQHKLKIGQGSISGKLNAGFFYGNQIQSILDFKHFMGNELWLTTHNAFRDLPYYTYSSDKGYLQTFLTWNPKKMIISQIPSISKKGVSEYLFFNALKNPYINYQEGGYGLSWIGKAVSGEVFWSFQEKQYYRNGFRLLLNISKK